jgi:hypothetical protein
LCLPAKGCLGKPINRENIVIMKLVFIGGYSRSGTTLLGAMVGAHTECICTPESQFKIDVLRHFREKKGEEVDIEKARRMIRDHPRYRVLWGEVADSASLTGINSYPELILWFVNRYAEKEGKPHPSVWVDHSPTNIKHAETLLGLFPASKFIHIIRDGRGVSASMIPLDWGHNTVYKTACSWKRTVSRYLSIEASLGKGRILRVRYEDLIQETEAALRDICSFLDLEYQPQMIKGSGFKVPGYQYKQHSLIGKEPDKKRVNAWEKALTPRQIEIFESIAGELLVSLGYALQYKGRAKKISIFEKIASEIWELYSKKIINNLRHRQRIKKGIASKS